MNGRMNNAGCFCSNNNGSGKKALFDSISAISFTLDELRLYLDTHPDCTEALSLFNDNMERRHTLIAEYTASYGPISSYYINSNGTWSWNDEPLPWKVEAN